MLPKYMLYCHVCSVAVSAVCVQIPKQELLHKVSPLPAPLYSQVCYTAINSAHSLPGSTAVLLCWYDTPHQGCLDPCCTVMSAVLLSVLLVCKSYSMSCCTLSAHSLRCFRERMLYWYCSFY